MSASRNLAWTAAWGLSAALLAGCQTYKTELDQEKTRTTELTQENRALKADLDGANRDLLNTKESLSKSETDAASAKSRADTLDAENQKLRNDLENAHGQMGIASAALKKSNADLAAAKKAEAEARDGQAKAEAAMQASDTAVSSLRDQNRSLEAQVSILHRDIQQAQSAAARAQSDLDAARHRVMQLESALAATTRPSTRP